MGGSQIYIGTLNGVVVCVDSSDQHSLSGRFFHSYSQEAVCFSNLEQLLFEMEQLFNSLRFPFPANNERIFSVPAPKKNAGSRSAEPSDRARHYNNEIQEKIMNDDELLSHHGDLGSFIIRVQHRQNSSWQGRITWMEKNQTVYFRSVWEMMKLIESAIDMVAPEDINEPEPSWTDDIN